MPNLSSKMEKIINNTGLQHILEKVFWDLDVEDLKICGQINQACKQILENPMFWLKKFRSLSKDNLKDWLQVIKLAKNTDKEKAIICYLQWNLKKEVLDVPCYSSPTVQDEFKEKIKARITRSNFFKAEVVSDEDIEIVKILAPLTDNLNAPDEYGRTPIQMAAIRGHTEIVRILAPFVNILFASPIGGTPLHEAARSGHTEIVKILIPLTDPNSQDEKGRTPIYWAARRGHTEIVNILAPLIALTENPNVPDENGNTPMHEAVCKGYTKIVKILAPLADDSNSKNDYGRTPIEYAKMYGHSEIVEILYKIQEDILTNHKNQC